MYYDDYSFIMIPFLRFAWPCQTPVEAIVDGLQHRPYLSLSYYRADIGSCWSPQHESLWCY